MSQSGDTEDGLKKKHKELCTQLNMDQEAEEQSWNNFEAVSKKYTLDGDPIHWLSCALYVACRKSSVPTVGLSGAAVEGNCVSLTKLLRLCNINLYQFFNLIKKWMEMASLPVEFCERVMQLERKVSVAIILFDKFKPIFTELFQPMEIVEPAKHTKGNKKIKVTPCNVNSVFEFCWCLFICAKGEFPSLSSDLVNMFHVLLSCLDFVYGNLVLDKRTDLLNQNFKGFNKEWLSPNLKTTKQLPCIMDTLCDIYKGLKVDAKTMKEFSWKDTIQNFFNNSILKGDNETMTGLLNMANFDDNRKSLNKVYETYVLSVGEFDERIFLVNQMAEQGKDANKPLSLSYLNPNICSLVEDTPLTGRKHLKNKVDAPMTPVTSTTHSVQRLLSYLSRRSAQPSESLQALCRDCKENPLDKVVEREKMMGDKFLAAYSGVSVESTARVRLNLIVTLYYELLESIIKEEIRKKPTIDVQALLGQNVFHTTLFGCCVEIVIYTYVTQEVRFPWVLELLTIPAFSFYKIIELVVLCIKEKLTRDVVKHLNAIEEQLLESICWESTSPLWDHIKKLEEPIPSWNDVQAENNPSHTVPVILAPNNANHGAGPSNMQSIQTIQSIRRLQTNSQGIPQSPVSSATDRFVLPSPDIARQLFRDSNTIKPGQSLLNLNNQQQQVTNSAPPSNGAAPKKIGSLGLFFRKFYSLAVVRMKDLCKKLRLTDEEQLQKIWTCLEYSVIHKTELMKDRHLDQMLMCAIYITCKVLSKDFADVERSFTDIMKNYRSQPQALPHVYRSVLIFNDNPTAEASNVEQNEPNMAPVPCSPPSPNRPAGQSMRHAKQERGDLIKFYNSIYVKVMEKFAMKFSRNNRNGDFQLSPLPPRDRATAGSQGPWRVSEEHNVYVRSLSNSQSQQRMPSNACLTYKFSRSPSKDLQTINCLVAQENMLKREASVLGESSPTDGPSERKVPCMAVRKLREFIPDQQATQ